VAWFETNQEFLRQRNRVETACALWEKENQDSAYLLPRGKPLADAIWLKNQTGNAGQRCRALHRRVQALR
jgi:hypothetical protein